MASDYYTRKRYGSSSARKSGYMSDDHIGMAHRSSLSRHNRSMSLDDLALKGTRRGSYSDIREQDSAYGSKSEIGNRSYGSSSKLYETRSSTDRARRSSFDVNDINRTVRRPSSVSSLDRITTGDYHDHKILGTASGVSGSRYEDTKDRYTVSNSRPKSNETDRVTGILKNGTHGTRDLYSDDRYYGHGRRDRIRGDVLTDDESYTRSRHDRYSRSSTVIDDKSGNVKYVISGELIRTSSPADGGGFYSDPEDSGRGRSRLTLPRLRGYPRGRHPGSLDLGPRNRYGRPNGPGGREPDDQGYKPEGRGYGGYRGVGPPGREPDSPGYGSRGGDPGGRGYGRPRDNLSDPHGEPFGRHGAPAGYPDGPGGRHGRSPYNEPFADGRPDFGPRGRSPTGRGGSPFPRSHSASPGKRSGPRSGSPMKSRPGRRSSMSDLGDREPRGRADSPRPRGRGQYGPDSASRYPVCSRWPNCTVCTIDIPANPVNKDAIMRTMKAELKEEIENIALLDKKEKEIQQKAENNAYLTQELQRSQKEVQSKESDMRRKDVEIQQLKSEIRSLEIEKKKVEQLYSEIRVQMTNVEKSETKMIDLQEENDVLLVRNRELIERIKNLEVAEKEFIELENNVIDLQDQLRDMETIEVHRDELYDKMQNLKKQRDDFLEKGRLVEAERNDFLRTNKTMEQRMEGFRKKVDSLKKSNESLSKRILVLEREKKELETKVLEIQNDRNVIQTALGKLEVERDDLIRELKEVTAERNILEQKLAELEDMNSDRDQLEEGFHSLRLKAKISLLKKASREKEETVTRLTEELQVIKNNIATSSMDDMSKIRSYGFGQKQKADVRETTYFKESNGTKQRPVAIDESDDNIIYSDEYSEAGSSIGNAPVYERREPRSRGRRSPGKKYVALFDYDPYKSSTSNHPDRELRLREGDYITVYGDMDVEGYLEAEVDGRTGLVPSIYVEDVDDSERTERVLVSRGRDDRHLTVSGGQRRRRFVCLYDYDPFTMGTTGRPDLQLSLRKGDVITIIGDIDVEGYYTAELNGRTGLVPSNFVREIGVSDSVSQGYDTYSSSRMMHSLSASRGMTSGGSTGFRGTIQVERDNVVGPPYPPTDLKLIRVVNKDTLLIGWGLPDMDQYGRSNGALVTGYRIWVNRKQIQGDIKSPTITKAVIEGVNLRDRCEIDVQTVAENGFCSEKCNMTITGAISLLNPGEAEYFSTSGQSFRGFVALYDYDPLKSSPNPNPALEVGFREGDIVKIYDTSRSDGFYQGEVRGKRGLIPSNFIEEVAFTGGDSMTSGGMTRGGAAMGMGGSSYGSQTSHTMYSESQTRSQTRSGYDSQMRDQGRSDYETRSNLTTTGGRRRKMVAVYDYDPIKQSPSKDNSKELPLKKGQYVTVIGDMRPDGFYVGESNGRQGLVPGDFLETSKDDEDNSRKVSFMQTDRAT